MTTNDRIERELVAWFGATASPRTAMDVDELMSLVAGTSQRPGWSFPTRWLPPRATLLGRRAGSPVPWRTIGMLAVLAVLLAAVVAVYVGGEAVRLPEPYGVARNGSVAFERQGDIVIVDPRTGTQTATIDLGSRLLVDPQFSRDGTTLAFRSETAGVGSTIYVARADGSDPRPVTTAPIPELESYGWSPDGRSMLLTTAPSMEGIRVGTLAVLPIDGLGHVTNLDVGLSVDMATWRPPDGQEIVFRGVSDSAVGLFAVRPDGTGLRRIIATDLAAATLVDDREAYAFSISPDGRSIAFEGSDPHRIYVVSADGGERRPITTAEAGSPVWSPDGRWIAYTDLQPFTPLYLAGPMSGRLAVIGTDGRSQAGSLPDGVVDGDPTWTPDGTMIIVGTGPFDCSREGGPCHPSRLILLDPRGGPSALKPWSLGSDWQRLAP